jgi:hypothetical protein
MRKEIRKKSVISLISYDANYLPESIGSYYNYVDEIVLGLDKDRISWSGNKFSFNEAELWSQLKKIDYANKITIVEENFHRSKTPIENDTHERNYLKSKCEYDWVFSFDADEVLVNAREFFIDFCPIVQDYKHIELMFTWYLLYKQVEGGYLIIADENREHLFKKDIQGFTADRDLHTFTYCRWTNSKHKVLSPLAIKHYSFCRSQEELSKKINNFGHSAESKQDPFYEVQKQINKQNYTSLRNFKTHGSGAQWPALKFVSTQDVDKYLLEESRLIYEN